MEELTYNGISIKIRQYKLHRAT